MVIAVNIKYQWIACFLLLSASEQRWTAFPFTSQRALLEDFFLFKGKNLGSATSWLFTGFVYR